MTDLDLRAQHWSAHAPCAEPGKQDLFTDERNTRALRRAQSICAYCPVLVQCAAYADTHPEVTGIYAGRWRGGHGSCRYPGCGMPASGGTAQRAGYCSRRHSGG